MEVAAPVVVTITGFLVLLEGAFFGPHRGRSRNLATGGLALALVMVVLARPGAVLGGTVLADRYALFLEAAILSIALNPLVVWAAGKAMGVQAPKRR